MGFLDGLLLLIVTVLKILLIIVPLLLTVAYLTYAERKVIGAIQVRKGPNRVGWAGLLQPIADVLKLLTKEVLVPTNSHRFLFVVAPILSLAPAFAAWAVIPFSDTAVLADVNAGLLYVLALTSLGVYGVIIAGWASNSKYAFLGAMRSAAQIVAYEIAMGFAPSYPVTQKPTARRLTSLKANLKSSQASMSTIQVWHSGCSFWRSTPT